MATALESVQSPRPERKMATSGGSDTVSVTMSPGPNHWNTSFNLSDAKPTQVVRENFDDEEKNVSDVQETKEVTDEELVAQLLQIDDAELSMNNLQQSTGFEASFDELELNQPPESQTAATVTSEVIPQEPDQLTNQIEELNEKITKIEIKTKKLEEEKKRERREHKAQLSRQKKKVRTLAENLRSKEESVIPKLLRQIEDKELALDECRKTLSELQAESQTLKDTLSKCNQDLSRTTEERDIVTTELKGHICDTGKMTNEMTEVLSVRENMAKQYYQEKSRLMNQIEMLQIEARRKQHLIDRLIQRVDLLEMHRPPEVAEMVNVMVDPHDPLNPNLQFNNRATRWCYTHIGLHWRTQIPLMTLLLVTILTFTGVVLWLV